MSHVAGFPSGIEVSQATPFRKGLSYPRSQAHPMQEDDRPESIMLLFLPIMLLSNSQKSTLLCFSNLVTMLITLPIMLKNAYYAATTAEQSTVRNNKGLLRILTNALLRLNGLGLSIVVATTASALATRGVRHTLTLP